MHLLSTRPGGYVEDDGLGVVRVAQTPGEIVILSAADTTLALLSDVASSLDDSYPKIRLANLMWLRQPASMDMYVDDVLRHARVVVIDHLGSLSEWAYVVDQAMEQAAARGLKLFIFSGDNFEDMQLLLRSNMPHDDCRHLWRCLREGGRSNAQNFFQFLGHTAFGLGERPAPAAVLPPALVYRPPHNAAAWIAGAPVAMLVFYRAHFESGNTALFDAMLAGLAQAGVNGVAVAVDSLKNPTSFALLQSVAAEHQVAVVLNATSFAVASIAGDDEIQDWQAQSAAQSLKQMAGDAPVLQLITAGCSLEQWQADPHGLAPRDLAMQVVLPEVDGRILTRAISFKGMAWRCERTQIDVVRYQPEPERIAFVAELTRRWSALRHKNNSDKRVALILSNYPNDDSRLANGVGLDTPASCVLMLQALQDAHYSTGVVPDSSDQLMALLLASVTNNVAANDERPVGQSLAMNDYLADFNALPVASRDAINTLWGLPQTDPMLRAGRFMISGQRFGNVFVGNQPARARGRDLVASYHDADLVPTHNYLAFYFWLRRQFAVDAVVHVGTHGNLEWLPGKSVALGATCWPDVILGPLPHLYPFIVNNPGEGSQAKRRTQAVIIDHLMPALMRAETYGPLQALERQMDEYYEALSLDPRRAKLLRASILDKVLENNLHLELGFDNPADDAGREALLNRLDAYLCEIKEAQIRDGLHTFGRSPTGRQRTDTLVALARFPSGKGADQGSLLVALAQDLSLHLVDGFDVLSPEWAQPWNGPRPEALQLLSGAAWRHAGHTRERLELLATQLVNECLNQDSQNQNAEELVLLPVDLWPQTAAVLQRLKTRLAPRLDACGPNEILQLLRGLDGRFVPPGPSGAPSRGRPDVLPTGRNFFSVDTRAVPTATAYNMGAKAANLLVERHLQDHGAFPKAVGLSVWGTSTMRTGGEDISQAFALLGVRPKWATGSTRVVDIEIMPMNIKSRPRIDVTLRVSGFFRDAFPNLIDLFDAAVRAVAAIPESEESDEVNPIRARVQREADQALAKGLAQEEAERQSTWRVFGPRPGGYGTGLQEVVDSGNWTDGADLAKAYLRAGSFAYGQDEHGKAAAEIFEQRLSGIDTIVHNQDNREHDILDSADYYQFQGGMAVAVKHLSGNDATLYHGDFSVPGSPRIRTLGEEVARVVRSRAVNPKWLEGIKRHGYKGAFEIAATVDFLFAFDATTGVVGDHQYELVADAYLHDADTREFLQQNNPGALRSVGERLLEAMRRGLWAEPGDQLERIQDHLLALEQGLEEAENQADKQAENNAANLPLKTPQKFLP
ncbi:Aerobic cobaltochelatase subunit CobN [Polaromonas vacuolata]|uniref:Cobaltochelatase subunit CobN n=1 Tax=Polaromonas vacuolata TaxID=37448 RepID=A0A6H2HBI3_9BURK|nr:cobaltochelatase subunit CobN [Polaromonas vacuolata]QJC57241.1 Aerobic cobaltochelatase subunit CobN [Polaromonas vacuolata]